MVVSFPRSNVWTGILKVSTQIKRSEIEEDEEMLKCKLKLIGRSFIISHESHFWSRNRGIKKILSSQ